jgi:hypothetical protein
VDLPGMYVSLNYAHRQHHAIVNALENGEGSRVAALMFEHAYGTKASINMSRPAWGAGSHDGAKPDLEQRSEKNPQN